MQEVDRLAAGAKYNTVAITLHWLIAVLIIANIVLGHVFEGMPPPGRIIFVVIHIQIGLLVLVLSVFRLFWRLGHPKPAYPATVAPWERFLATATQVLFYILMIGLPIVGYLLLSANQPNPKWALKFLGFIPIPFVESLQMMEPTAQKAIHDRFVAIHAIGAWIMVLAIALHLAGVVKHMVIDKTNILARMLPGRAQAGDARP